MKNWPSPSAPSVPNPPTVPAPRRRQRGGNAIVTAGTVTLGLLALSMFSGSHLIFALIALPVVATMAWSNPEGMLAILPVWLVVMGLVRRLTPGGGNVTFSGDPVLIVGPVALLVLWAFVATRREPGQLSTLARCVFAFNVIAVLEALNPAQGSLLTGVGGLLFIFVPTTAFWIGRRYAEPLFVIRIIWTVAILGLVAAIYGLFQQFVGFPSWDTSWINSKGYTALNVGGGVVRAFSSFSSAEEYAVFLSVAAVAWVALLGRGTRWPIFLHWAAIITVMVALFYESQRTSFFLVFLALGVMAASRMGLRPLNVVLAGVVSIVLLIALAGALGGGGGGSSALQGQQTAAQVLAQHQISGITHPTSASSSLNGHIHQTKVGILEGLKRPEGHGTGSVNLAASRYTAANKLHGTEFDPGNMGIAFGLPGLVVYALLVFFALRTAYRLAVRRRDAIGLFVIGILATTLFQWTNGDLYSVCWLIWLAMGFGDALLATGPSEATAEVSLVGANDGSWDWRRPGGPRRGAANW